MTVADNTYMVITMIKDYFEPLGYHVSFMTKLSDTFAEIRIGTPDAGFSGGSATWIIISLLETTEIRVAYGRWMDLEGPLLLEDPDVLPKLERIVRRDS